MPVPTPEIMSPQSWTGIDDVIIVGGGLAGLFCALKLAPRPVTVVTAAPIGQGASTAWAQGGIAAAVSEGDSPESHLQDTLVAGAGIVDERIAYGMVKEARARIDDLLGYGVPFDRDLEGHLNVSREAAHSARRIVRVRGDMAGKAVLETLVTAVRNTPSIRVLEGYVAEDLIHEGRFVSGLVARPHGGSALGQVVLPARAVVLASGGVGQLYAVTTNPAEANGSGMAMAARAGAVLADCEFIQFHPTAFNIGKDPAPLATEALRGDGCTLINSAGERFMLKLHELAELGPRDVVARGVHNEVVSGRGAFLDCRTAIGASFPDRFPTVFGYAMAAGFDPREQPIRVAPAAHYHMGGVLVDASGRTTVDGLWACGETASTGAHGANRLASNSLLEAVVFAARVAEDISGMLPASKVASWTIKGDNHADVEMPVPANARIRELRQLMSSKVGVVRGGESLREALLEIQLMLESTPQPQLRNMLTAAKIITACALKREESRGAHSREDFPLPRNEWQHRTFTTLREVDAEVARLVLARRAA